MGEGVREASLHYDQVFIYSNHDKRFTPLYDGVSPFLIAE